MTRDPPLPGSTPARDAPEKAQPARRFVKRGYYMCCVDCGLTVDYCNCASHPALDPGAADGADSTLRARINVVKELNHA